MGLAYSAGTHIRLTHGYEFFLTVGLDIEPDGDIDMRQIPGGLYAVLRFKNWITLEMPGNIYGTGDEIANMKPLEFRKVIMIGLMD